MLGTSLEEIERILTSSDAMADSFQHLRFSDAPVQHQFELIDDNPLNHCKRNLAPNPNQIVQKKVDMILKAGIATLATSACSFLVVIYTWKHSKRRFCVDYQILNQTMKANRIFLLRIQKIFDKLADGVFSLPRNFPQGIAGLEQKTMYLSFVKIYMDDMVIR